MNQLKTFIVFAALCIPWSTPVHGAQLVIGEPSSIVAGVDFFEAQEYKITFWKQLRNTYLRTVSRKALEAGLPYNAYNVEAVEQNLCNQGNPYITQQLGKAIAIVERETHTAAEMPTYKGIKLKFHPEATATLDLGDLCVWLTSDESRNSYDVVKLYQGLSAATPPTNGEWIETDLSTNNFLSNAKPTFKGIVPNSPRPPSNIHWEVIGMPTPVTSDTSYESISGAIRDAWAYVVNGEPSGLYLTTAIREIGFNLMGNALTASFDWALPEMLNLEPNEIPILWTTSEHQIPPDNLFLMMAAGLPTVAADIYFDKSLATGLHLTAPAWINP